MKNKVKLSLALSANDPAQMSALSKFALALSQIASAELPDLFPGLKRSNTPDTSEENVYLGLPDGVLPTSTKSEAEAVVKEATQRKRRTQAEIKAEREEAEQVSKPEPAESEPAEVEDEAPKSPAPSKITLDDVRRAIADKKEKHLQIMKFKLQEEFGVSKAPDLKPDQYEAYYNFLTALD